MMAVSWVILILASTGLQLVQGLPIHPPPRIYPHEVGGSLSGEWTTASGPYTSLLALALVLTVVGLLFGCTWCYRHKDCKPREGTDNQLFTASVTHLTDGRRSQPPDSGFSEPANNNISEDNNNGPISLREMQNIANNNAAAYIVSENEERNRISRESVVEFEPLPAGIRVIDPLERCADWFAGEDFSRNQLQYLREIGRGWFGRVVEGEIEDGTGTSTVAVKILNQNASLEDKARFLDEARVYRDINHENVLRFVTKCLQEDPWILIFELCSMDLQQYLVSNRPKMAILNERGVPLQILSDVSSALAHLHARGFLYGDLWSGNVLVRDVDGVRGVLGRYSRADPPPTMQVAQHTASGEVWSLGLLVWEVCAWGAAPPAPPASPPPLPCPYRDHLYQVMQLCWNPNPDARPSAAQVHALINHLHFTHSHAQDSPRDDGYSSSDFEDRWQRLKPNTIPKLDEHVAIVHAPSTSMASQFTGSDQDFDNHTVQDTLSVEMDTAVSRSSSIMSDKDPLSVQIKSDSLTNLHGSLEDVRNIYLTHNETATLECHQGNIGLEDSKEREQDRSDSSMDPWIKEIITGSQDDVSYYKDVSDVIKNLDNILNSEKTSSSESSHQASPSRDNLSLECKKDYPMQKSMVKSPGISNFQNILEMGFDSKSDMPDDEDDGDRDTIGTLSHSFERHSDTVSQQTLENITPETPSKDLDVSSNIIQPRVIIDTEQSHRVINEKELNRVNRDSDLPKDNRVDCSDSNVPKLNELCVVSTPSVSETVEQVILKQDCQTPYDNNFTDIRTGSADSKSIEVNKAFISNEIEHTSKENFSLATCENSLCEKVNSMDTEIAETQIVAKDALKDPFCLVIANCSQVYNEGTTLNEALQNDLKLSESKNPTIQEKSFLDEGDMQTHSIEIEREKKCASEVVTPTTANLLLNELELGVHNETENECKNVTVSCNISTSNHQYAAEKFDKTSQLVNHDTPLQNLDSQLSTANVDSDLTNHITEKTIQLLTDSIESLELKKSIESEKAKTLKLDENLSPTIQKEILSVQQRMVKVGENQNHVDDINVSTNTVEEIVNEKVTISENNSDETSQENIIQYFEFLNTDFSDSKCDSEIDDTQPTGSITNHLEQVEATEPPEIVQIENNVEISSAKPDKLIDGIDKDSRVFDTSIISPEIVQNKSLNILSDSKPEVIVNETESSSLCDKSRSDAVDLIEAKDKESGERTEYIDLINDTNNQLSKDTSMDDNIKEVIKTCLESSHNDPSCTLIKNESTVYLDLPSITKEIDNFLQAEKTLSSQTLEFKDNICASTPKGSDNSVENTLAAVDEDTEKTKVPDDGPGVALTKLEQRCVPENLSPFESPSKSHHTDTYDENSSVVLGPFENCSLELYKVIKSNTDLADLPKEELLAFSSNFSEMNLETPSPLRDGNFLNEVPDIVPPDDLHFDDVVTLSEAKPESQTTNNTDETEEQSSTEKRVSPLTPPNSPGNFLASTSQQKYLVDIDIDSSNVTNEFSSNQDAIDLNQIELQMTTKLAMAENENNMNIEYSGPLTEEGLTLDDSVIMRDNDAIPESYLAGNGGSVEELREDLAIDEERMKELRNELELKLPLAQVAGIEPAVESEWTELPPPPELIVTYGALSPIAEETRTQLCAYENDDQWNTSFRTSSSESYPEPCASEELTDVPAQTYTLQSAPSPPNHTYTVNKEAPSSKEITMSADSLNASPLKKLQDIQSPIDDKTYTKNDDEKESNCERLSQVSPFLLSPTTDTSVPESSENTAGMSTLSKTTVPTDAKSSKPSETQCLSKATSIDSWCSNDTLYNVEENFDDLVMDPDLPLDFEPELEKDKSESEDTLTHIDDEKELSHCSTYIIHDSKSEVCETFSPDSITANDNYTYTKAKTEAAGATPSVITKSDLNDSTKNSQTKDLAYGTLMSGLPSYSNCTTELVSGIDDAWKLPAPELVRRSPIGDEVNFTPPKQDVKKENSVIETPLLSSEPRIKKMDSVEITCLTDDISVINKFESTECVPEVNDSPNMHFRNMAHSVTSTPFSVIIQDCDNCESIPIELPQNDAENSELNVNNVPNFQAFFQSAEIRPQDISPDATNEGPSTEILLDGESKTFSRDSNRDATDKTPTYSDFESSATTKPQDLHSKDKSGQSIESGVSTEDFRQFENSVKNRPQDLSSVIDASSLLLKSERRSSELAMGSLTNTEFDQTSRTESDRVNNTEPESQVYTSCNFTNLIESQNVDNSQSLNVFITDLDIEEETEQPHSIIITESPLIASKVSPNRTFDSHTKANRSEMNYTYDSHTSGYNPAKNIWQNDSTKTANKINGVDEGESVSLICNKSEDKIPIQNNSLQACVSTENNKSTDSLIEHNSKPQGNIKEASILSGKNIEASSGTKCNGSEMYATVNFLNETFEELMESNVDDNDVGSSDINKDEPTISSEKSLDIVTDSESIRSPVDEKVFEPESNTETLEKNHSEIKVEANGIIKKDKELTLVTDDFLENEKKFCQLDSFFPLLSDIRFTGPATEIMSTSFTQDSPTEPTSGDADSKRDALLRDWDSDSDSHSTNSSSGEFIWKDGDGRETSLVPSTHFDHQQQQQQRDGSQGGVGDAGGAAGDLSGLGGGGSSASGDSGSGSGSEGDEVEFVPSSWDCRAAPSKSSLRSMEQPPDSKKRVVFKRQKYHCVYEYPREAYELDADSPAAYLPDFSTYSDWDPSSAEEAELGYGQLFGAPSALDMFPLRAGIAFGADYDEDFFISSSARPFESLGVMSTTSQFFPGMHVKAQLEREPSDELSEDFPPPPSPLPPTTLAPLAHTRTPSLDFTTPDSGVEDITPGSLTDDDYKAKKLPESETCWKADSASSSESVSPSSPGEALGGLRHTRDKLKLDLPPSPHVPSPKHNRVFNFVLDKPKRPERTEPANTPLVMSDETPVLAVTLPVPDDCDDVMPEPTFSTFGKSTSKPAQNTDTEKSIILTDEVESTVAIEEVKEESSGARVEGVKGEGTVLDSGDEDSGIESSAKATLERKPAPNVS